jgi:hypothetical protein
MQMTTKINRKDFILQLFLRMLLWNLIGYHSIRAHEYKLGSFVGYN